MCEWTGLSEREVRNLNETMSRTSAQEVIAWAVSMFGTQVALASSFGAEDVVLIDMLAKTTESPNVFFLDTGRLNQKTYDVVDEIRNRYSIEIQVYAPQTELVERLLREKGSNSFRHSIEDRKECCRIRKVEPLSRALSGVYAWITGLRRSQSVTRLELNRLELDESHGRILKINPLVDWSEKDVWAYIKANRVPYNRLHDQGYPSIGCEPCTRPIEPGEDPRAGRWWWESPEHKECGLHISDVHRPPLEEGLEEVERLEVTES